MKGRVSKKTAAARKSLIEERQIPITEKRMDRFAGRTMDVLIEEELEAADSPGTGAGKAGNGEKTAGLKAAGLWLGRLFCHAPEVDGAAVVRVEPGESPALKAGDIVPCRVMRRAGFDLEVSATHSQS
jgi:ribosomal protein S12 methylthiotransferase